MTVDFGGNIGIVTDDSRQADKDVTFLVTKLNKSYIYYFTYVLKPE